MDTAESDAAADFSAVRENAKLILSADLTLETQEYDTACAAIERMTAEAGGYIESSGSYGEKGSRTANYTLRVPQEKFETMFTQLGESCHVVSSNRWSEDVTMAYTDIETRLATLRTKHERLLALLDQAGKMEDIIELENALADCEYEIDTLTGEMRHYHAKRGADADRCLRGHRLWRTGQPRCAERFRRADGYGARHHPAGGNAVAGVPADGRRRLRAGCRGYAPQKERTGTAAATTRAADSPSRDGRGA